MNMKLYRLLALLLLAAMLLVSFVACGGEGVVTNKPNDTVAPDSETEGGRDSVKDSVPADLNFADRNDNTVTFFVRSNDPYFLNEICVDDITNDILYDAIHYRNMDVEARLGVKIVQIAQPGSEQNTDWQTWNAALSTAVLTNTHDYDAAAIHTYCGSVLALQNIFADLNTLQDEEKGGYLDLSKPWWNQNSIDSLTVYGSLYFVGGDIMFTETARTYAVFFNKDLFNEKFPEENYANLYTLVNEGKWTIDKMISYTSSVWDDVNASGVMDDGDVAGFVYFRYPTLSTWVYALGMDFISKDQYGEQQLSYIYDPDIIPAFEAVAKLYDPQADGVLGGQSWKETHMGAGNVLFGVDYLSAGEQWRDTSVNYGVLPMPKFNEAQEDYRTSFVGHVSALAICSDISAERTPIITATCELLCAESYKNVLPAYYSKVLQGLYSKDQPDAEMYDRIIETVVIDFGACMFPKTGTALTTYHSLFSKAKTPGYDIAQDIAGKTEAWETAFEQMMASFEDLQD